MEAIHSFWDNRNYKHANKSLPDHSNCCRHRDKFTAHCLCLQRFSASKRFKYVRSCPLTSSHESVELLMRDASPCLSVSKLGSYPRIDTPGGTPLVLVAHHPTLGIHNPEAQLWMVVPISLLSSAGSWRQNLQPKLMTHNSSLANL